MNAQEQELLNTDMPRPCTHGVRSGHFCKDCKKWIVVFQPAPDIIIVDDPAPTTRLDMANHTLRRYLRPEGCTIHCIIDHSRSGATSKVRVFTGGFAVEGREEPWIIDLTTSVAELFNAECRYPHSTVEPWMFLRLTETYKPKQVARMLQDALHYPKDSIRGRYL